MPPLMDLAIKEYKKWILDLITLSKLRVD